MVFSCLMSSRWFALIPGTDLILKIRIKELGAKTVLILSDIVPKPKAHHITEIVR